MAIVDRTGERYGKLVVFEYAYTKKRKAYWKCRCDCGNEKIVSGSNLQSGNTKSCGCGEEENRKEHMAKFTVEHRIHGLSNTRLHHTWRHMIDRCSNRNNKDYSSYGGRGISICNEWLGENGFQNFYEWAIEHGYDDTLSIDRINNDGDYEPNNCRWIDDAGQANNRRTNKILAIGGKSQTFAEWCKQCGIGYYKVRDRMDSGWTAEEALELKPRERSQNERTTESNAESADDAAAGSGHHRRHQ